MCVPYNITPQLSRFTRNVQKPLKNNSGTVEQGPWTRIQHQPRHRSQTAHLSVSVTAAVTETTALIMTTSQAVPQGTRRGMEGRDWRSEEAESSPHSRTPTWTVTWSVHSSLQHYLILSYLILSYLILSYLILSYLTLSYLIQYHLLLTRLPTSLPSTSLFSLHWYSSVAL